jgi:pilus assembly protein CpaC
MSTGKSTDQARKQAMPSQNRCFLFKGPYGLSSRCVEQPLIALLCGLLFMITPAIAQQNRESQYNTQYKLGGGVAGGAGPFVGRSTALFQLQRQPADAVGKINPHIRKMPVPEYKLEVIENRSQLIVTNSRIVRTDVANPEITTIVQYSPTEIALIGLDRGATNVALWFEGDEDPTIYLVSTIRDPSIEEQQRLDYGILERKIAKLFPNSRVFLIPFSAKIVVKGQARDTEEAAKIIQLVRGEVINQLGGLAGPQPAATDAGFDNLGSDALNSDAIINLLEVPGEYQVMLRVRIAELNRSQLRRMGVDWNVLFNNGKNFMSGGVNGLPAALTGIFEDGDIEVFVNWLASNGTVSVLAEPVLTVMSGHSASFLSGGEFAVPTVVGIGGAQGQTTSFRGFGTSLQVTPTVVDRDLIRLRIVPEFSQINAGNAVGGIPGVDARRVTTTVQLREGQTIVLGGLLGRQTSTEVTRIPLLGELPFIGGKLFNGKEASEGQTELLILVSPEIVRPMDAEEVPPLPNYYVTHPDDFDLYKYARSEGNPDTQIYQLPPYGHGTGHAVPIGYQLFAPPPVAAAPSPTQNYMNTNRPAYGRPQAMPMQMQPAPTMQPPQAPSTVAPQPLASDLANPMIQRIRYAESETAPGRGRRPWFSAANPPYRNSDRSRSDGNWSRGQNLTPAFRPPVPILRTPATGRFVPGTR